MAVRLALLLLLSLGVGARGQALQAPARVQLHAGAAPGDTLERTTEQRGVRSVERTAVVGREGEDVVVEKTGPAWAGLTLRLVVAKDGRVRSAAAGAAGEAPRAIDVAPDPPPADEEQPGPVEEVTTPAGTFRCRKRTLERQEPLPFSSTRWVVEEGPRAGLLVRQVTQVAGRATTVELLALEEVTETIGPTEVPCLHATRRATLDGVPSPPVEEWVALKPLLFGETLVRLENGLGSARITAIRNDGKATLR